MSHKSRFDTSPELITDFIFMLDAEYVVETALCKAINVTRNITVVY